MNTAKDICIYIVYVSVLALPRQSRGVKIEITWPTKLYGPLQKNFADGYFGFTLIRIKDKYQKNPVYLKKLNFLSKQTSTHLKDFNKF